MDTGTELSGRPETGWRRRVPYPVALLIVLIVVGSIVPAPSLESWAEMVAELRAGATFTLHPPILITLLERLVTFLPLGLLLHREFLRRRPGRAALWAGCAVLGVALAVELMQLPLAGRHTRLSDLIVAVAWGACGILLSEWLGAPAARAKLRLVLVALLVLGNATLTFSVARGHRNAELSGWDCNYPLLIGNELTEDRPWLGRIRGLAIYPRALSADEAQRLQTLPFAGPGTAVRERMGSLAAFDFAEVTAHRVPQLLADRPGPDLRLPQAGSGTWRVVDRALELQRPLLIESASPPRALCQALMQSRALAIEAEIASAGSDQGGPARIVSQSTGPMQRDFTLGQEGSALVFRVRTPWNGRNGMHQQLTAWDALPDQGWHHVVPIYAQGGATLFLDGRQIAPTVRYYDRMWLGEADVVPLAGFAGIGFVALGLVMALLTAGASWPARLTALWLGAALIPTATGLALGLELGHDPDGWLIAAAVLGPPIGLLIGRSGPWLAARWRR